jgi:hypothetical protein
MGAVALGLLISLSVVFADIRNVCRFYLSNSVIFDKLTDYEIA